MNRAFLSVLAMMIVGCANKQVIFEMYSKKPITPECAYSALSSNPVLKSVHKSKLSVNFTGAGFNGELYHGGEENESFTNFGLDLNITSVFKNNPQELAKKVTEPMYLQCAK